VNQVSDPEQMLGPGPYDPLPLIRAVNALQPLGKDRALAVVGEYLRVVMECRLEPEYGTDWGSARLFPLLNVLFAVSTGPKTHPELREYAESYPMLVQDDIPLMLLLPHGGTTQLFYPPDLEPYRRYGTLRVRRLRPSPKPLAVIARINAASGWDRVGLQDERWREDKRHQAMNQLLRLIEPVHPLNADAQGNRIARTRDLNERWQRIVQEVNRLPLRWDARRQAYAVAQGRSKWRQWSPVR
jgi:hypothetical protein